MTALAEQSVADDDGPNANAVRMTQIAWDLGYRDEDVVRIAYRQDGDAVVWSVLYGASLNDIVKSLCRKLAVTPSDIEIERAGQPKRPDMAWIVVVRGERAGWRAARISGVAIGWLTIELDRVRLAGWRPPIFSQAQEDPA